MFELKVQGSFSAAHKLRDYGGDCENLHGHNWTVEMAVAGERDDKGMVVDFKVLKKVLNQVLEKLDHSYLNELEYFEDHNTTTENIAKYIFEEVSRALPEGLQARYVSTWESAGSGVTYSGGQDRERTVPGEEDRE